MRKMDRRGFLTIAGAAGVAAATQSPLARAGRDLTRVTGYPFTLGVASGDPAPDGAVLWTRLAPSPLSGGGMPQRRVPVDYEVALDERFRRTVRRGTTDAQPQLGHSVHVELAGLQPEREYFFRFRAAGELSPVGRTITAPAAEATPDALAFAFVSCSQYEHGYFTAYGRLAEEDLDVVVHLGDYIYEYGPNVYDTPGGNVRAHSSREITTLEDYRNRHAQYKTDPDLQTAHARFPWIVTWDDHEADFDDPDSETLGSELVCSSITSGGDGSAGSPPANRVVFAESPDVKYNDNRRGYVRCQVDRKQWKADFRVVPYVKRPGAPVATDKSFVIEAGRPGLQPAP